MTDLIKYAIHKVGTSDPSVPRYKREQLSRFKITLSNMTSDEAGDVLMLLMRLQEDRTREPQQSASKFADFLDTVHSGFKSEGPPE